MEHDTTSEETTDEMNAGCGGGGSGPYLPNCFVPTLDLLPFDF